MSLEENLLRVVKPVAQGVHAPVSPAAAQVPRSQGSQMPAFFTEPFRQAAHSKLDRHDSKLSQRQRMY